MDIEVRSEGRIETFDGTGCPKALLQNTIDNSEDGIGMFPSSLKELVVCTDQLFFIL